MNTQNRIPFGEAKINPNVRLINITAINMTRNIPPYNPTMKQSTMSFEAFLEGLLKKHTILSKEIRNIILKEKKYIDTLRTALTDPSANPNNNLELFEIVGDSSLHHALSRFIIKRFPQLSKIQDLILKKVLLPLL